MSPGLMWTRYIRYIGAGAVAAGGLITLIKSFPTMVESFRIGTKQIRERVGNVTVTIPRTSQDLPLKVVGIGAGIIIVGMAVIPQVFGNIDSLAIRLLAALLIVIFSFFFCYRFLQNCWFGWCNIQSHKWNDDRRIIGNFCNIPFGWMDR